MLKRMIQITVLLLTLNILISCCSSTTIFSSNFPCKKPENNSQAPELVVKSLIKRLECQLRQEDSSSSIEVKMAPFVALSVGNSTSETCPFGTLDYDNQVDEKQKNIQLFISENSTSCLKISQKVQEVQEIQEIQEVTESHYVMYAVIKEIITGFDPRSAEPRFHYQMIVRIADNKNPGVPFLTDDYALIEKNKVKPRALTASELPKTVSELSKMEENYRGLYPVICASRDIPTGIIKKFKQKLEEAELAFDNNQFENAITLYQKAFQIMRNKSLEYHISLEDKDKLYSGIMESHYQVNFKEKNNPIFLANIYFEKWLENLLKMNEERKMNEEIKWSFLFEEDSTKFADDIEIKEEKEIYPYRLQMIGTYFKNSGFCLKIVGYNDPQHEQMFTSSSGENGPISLTQQRMNVINQALKQYAPDINPIIEEETTSGDSGDSKEHQRVRLFVVEECPKGKE